GDCARQFHIAPVLFWLATADPGVVVRSLHDALLMSATYRERIALPPVASFEATLEDVSQADAAAIVLGTARLEPAGQPPFRFTIEYDPSKLEPGRNYAVRAKVTQAGQLWFTSDRHYALPSA